MLCEDFVGALVDAVSWENFGASWAGTDAGVMFFALRYDFTACSLAFVAMTFARDSENSLTT
ncbi:hypothetical protein ASE08_24345 [Rhizobacter sp. Root16D2]|nr:hypothetical protein ASC88_27735 [Rhizobacter sp. Root29]KQW11272.1 hypothetical protein ASC98_22035 [Rhizobacter sp. Root1238]KRB18217.1 hypothetical protein ASE08_24345 [Rhizobacter sp. Root16D2]